MKGKNSIINLIPFRNLIVKNLKSVSVYNKPYPETLWLTLPSLTEE